MSVHYIPILKSKRGEYTSLEELIKADIVNFTPLIETLPLEEEEAKAKEKGKTVDLLEFITKRIVKPIEKGWPKERRIFVDFILLNNTHIASVMQNGMRPGKYAFEQLIGQGYNVVPVTFFKAHKDYQLDLKNTPDLLKNGLCIRLRGSDLTRSDLDTTLDAVVNYFNVPIAEIDLIIDLEDLLDTQVDVIAHTCKDLINTKIPSLNEWRSIALAASSFPMNLSGVDRNSDDTKFTRVEWAIWLNLWQQKHQLKRMPDFSDYTILHSQLPVVSKEMMNRSAQIRYTIDNEWLIVKGVGIKQGGSAQTHVLCRILTEKDEYAGQSFSYGDNYIYLCARNEAGKGNAEVWRRVENNHHITHVVKTLANYSVS